jgi:hypothetical protein
LGLEAKADDLALLKKLLLRKSKEVKARTGKSARTFQARLWLKRGCFADDDED